MINPQLIPQKIIEPSQEWIEQELGAVSLGDKRLDWRLLDTAKKLASKPGASINQASEAWHDTKGSYRLFANKKTTSEKIFSPHQERTKARASEHDIVLAIQDTSFLDYTHHPKTEGLGPIGTEKQKIRGFVMHTTLVTTCMGLPLGLASQDIWTREEEAKKLSKTERANLPIEEKESYKWIQALENTVKTLPKETQVVTVGDSESDVFELFDCARTLETDLLIRAAQDRSVCEPEIGLLWSTLGSQPIAGHATVHVTARNNEPKRDAIVSIRHAKITLKTPERIKSKMENIPLYAVLVQEQNPPNHVEKPLCWLLLTTVPVLTLDDALERIQWYRIRWHIELYHKVLKSGCRVEHSKLATAERLLPFITLLSIIAWRLFWLTHLQRHEPDAPCSLILAEHEWHALYAYHHKSTHIPEQVPTVAQATLWIAQLGGFLARKNDGVPGVTVLWRGWQRLSDISDSWLLFHPYETCG